MTIVGFPENYLNQKNGYDTYTGTDLLTGKELSKCARILRGLSDLVDFSFSKDKKTLKPYVEVKYLRLNDAEAKILEAIASKIDFNTKGVIDLYTELPTCQGCTNLILELRHKCPSVTLNIFTKY